MSRSGLFLRREYHVIAFHRLAVTVQHMQHMHQILSNNEKNAVNMQWFVIEQLAT